MEQREKRLLLTSTGLQPSDYQKLMAILGREKLYLGIIPNACLDWQHSRQIKIVQENFSNAAKVQIIDLEKIQDRHLWRSLKEKSAMYVCGGDIFRLLEWAKRSGLAYYVNEFVSNGGVYIGTSAGSMIAGPTIELATIYPDFNGGELTTEDFNGFLLTKAVVVPHFEDAMKDALYYFAQRTHHPIIGLPNKQSVFIQNGHVTFLGNGKRIFINGMHPLSNQQQSFSQRMAG